jgi:hypothetical protein
VARAEDPRGANTLGGDIREVRFTTIGNEMALVTITTDEGYSATALVQGRLIADKGEPPENLTPEIQQQVSNLIDKLKEQKS